MVTFHDCPNCGANIPLGDDAVARCTFCGTEIAIPRAVETEREQKPARGARDFLIPPAGCCGIYIAVFMVGSLILTAAGLDARTDYRAVVAAIAIAVGIAGGVRIAWRREARRRDR